MKVVGNCPSCGNPIWADGPETTKRTCFCLVPVRTQPITIQIPPAYAPQPYYPSIYPSWTGVGGLTSTATNVATISGQVAPKDPPPDADAGMVT